MRYHFFALSLLALSATTLFAQRNLKEIPDPNPELERQTFILPEGFEVNLYAGDPQIAKPIQMNFDERGRLWIASSEVYPHIKPGQKPTDKILVLEDIDRDGTADRTTTFVDGLLIPTGVLPGDGGVYVANSTELVHFSDTDGDGKSDRRRTMLSGFGTEDTHHLLHTLRWGPDGAIYMNQSIYIHSHIETPRGVRRMNGGGIWRFRPDTMELDTFCLGFVNPWGHHHDAWGQSFATDGAYGEGINYVFPGSVFVTSPGAKRRIKGLNPGSPKHCGLEIVSGRHLPEEWQGNMITNDFRAHRVCRFVVSEDRSGYSSKQEQELIKSNHPAFRPIDVKVGPDGAIYIADWYNPIIQHGEVDFRDPRRDHVHGRIWRVTCTDRDLVPWPEIADASIPELLDMLKLPEEFTRLRAKLKLKEFPVAEVETALWNWANRLDQADPDYDHDRLEALWAFQTVGLKPLTMVESLLRSEDYRVRAAAMRVASLWFDEHQTLATQFTTGAVDEHPRVRLEAIRALAKLRTETAASDALQALDLPMDDNLDFALWQTMRDLQDVWLPTIRTGVITIRDTKHLAFALNAVESPDVVAPLLKIVVDGGAEAGRLDGVAEMIASLARPEELRQVLDWVREEPNLITAKRAKSKLLDALLTAYATRKAKPTGDLETVMELLKADSLAMRATTLKLAGAWQLESQRELLTQIANGTKETSGEMQAAAIEAVAMLGGVESVKVLDMLARPNQDVVVRSQAVASLARIAPKLAAERMAQLLVAKPKEHSPAELIDSLMTRKQGPPALVAALNEVKLDTDTAKLLLRGVQASPQRTDELIAAVRKAGNLADAGWKLSPAETEQLVSDIVALGDPAAGESIYRRNNLQCMKCHAIGGAGGVVGPDMISIGASAPVDYLLQSLLDPNAKVKENFHALTVQTDEGRVFTGIPVRRTDRELVLRDAEDREQTIAVDSIVGEKEARSLMPAGLVNDLTRDELRDLVSFLSQLGKDGPFAVGKEPVIRKWESLVWTQEGNRRLNRTSYDTAATDDATLTWRPEYSRVAGDLPTDDLAKFVIHRDLDATSFIRTKFELTSAGLVEFELGDVTGLSLWVNGKPMTIASTITLGLPVGEHRVTLAVNRIDRAESVRMEVVVPEQSKAVVKLIGGK